MLVSTIAAAIRSSKHQLRGPTSKIAVVARVGRDHSQRNERPHRRATRWKYHPNVSVRPQRFISCAQARAFLARAQDRVSATDTNWQGNDVVASAWHAEGSQQELLVGRVGKEG